jgi:KDO2-lipid IV(A) lauroyltransferase
MSRTPTLAHRAEYALFAGAVAIGRRMGDGPAARFGAFLGRLGYRPLGIRRRLTEAHIRAAFPDRDERWVRRTAAAAYAHLGREALATLRMVGLPAREILARTAVDGLESLEQAIRGGRGVVLVAGHLGNWEIGAAALAARGVAIDVVAQRQSNPLFDRAIVRARERLGIGVIERSRAPRQALRSLRAGRAVAFASDQNAGRAGVFVPFFGRLASTHRGAAVLALRTGAPVFLALPLRGLDGGYLVRLQEIRADRAGDADEAVHRLTAAFTAALEAAVRAAPDQYLWLHRRWKTRPPEERMPGGTVYEATAWRAAEDTGPGKGRPSA